MIDWQNIGEIAPRVFRCGYCGEKVSSAKGYPSNKSYCMIYICPNCTCPTYIDHGEIEFKQYPGVAYGNKVESIPEGIEKLYNEARYCVSVDSYTASVMACRKLLMNIAVENGAVKGKTYKEYVDYLEEKHYTPPDSKKWVDHIRQKGNEANHEIVIMEKKDSEEVINFIEMLLKFIFEFPGKMKDKLDNQNTDES